MGWVDITHPDGSVESYGDRPQLRGGAWDYPASDVELYFPHSDKMDKTQTLKYKFWHQVVYWGFLAYCPVQKIETTFNPLGA
jgi:hypothetical protein